MKTISIIAPAYNEVKNISVFIEEVHNTLSILNWKYEIIIIDDCSTDGTFELLKELCSKQNNIKVYKLSKNFGKENALTCGFHHATGDVIIPLDVDLQDPPELIPRMLMQWEKGYKVVLMHRKTREDSFLKKISASLFYFLINKMSDSTIYNNIGDFRLLDKDVVHVINTMSEKNRFMKGILSWPGFKTCTLEYDRPPRVLGTSKQTYKKLISLGLNGIFSFSTIPLKITTFAGVLVSFLSLIYAIMIIIKKIVWGIDVQGYPSLLVTILFLGGIQLISIGILGEYIARIFIETKDRPLYIIEEKIES